MYRSHGTKGSNRDYWSPAYASVFPLIKQSLELRLALAPYLYTSARQAHDTGVAAVHSLYLDWPEEPTAFERPDSYMHGSDILVRPVTAPAQHVDSTASAPQTVPVWLPPTPTGWVEWASSSGAIHGKPSASRGSHRGGGGALTTQASATLGVLPMYVRAGSVIPLLPGGTLDATAVAHGDAINWAIFLGGAVGTMMHQSCESAMVVACQCGADQSDPTQCTACAGRHQGDLHSAGCTAADIESYCHRGGRTSCCEAVVCSSSRYWDAGDSTAYEGPNGAFAKQSFSYTLSKESGGTGQVLNATIAAAAANGGFVLSPTRRVLHSIEVRGRRAPDVATMAGIDMSCSTVQAAQQSLARPAGTVVCTGVRSRLDAAVEAVLRWR
jgi:hypothetical protein